MNRQVTAVKVFCSLVRSTTVQGTIPAHRQLTENRNPMGDFGRSANMDVVGTVVSSRQDCGIGCNGLYASIAGYQRLQMILWCPSLA